MFFVIKTLTNKDPIVVGDTANLNEKNSLLKTAAKTFVIKKYGIVYSEIEIETVDLDNLVEPLIDTVKIFKTDRDDTLHVYNRSSITVPGYIYGQSVETTFKKVATFSISEYTNSNLVCNIPLTFISTETTGVPLKMKLAPLSNLLNDIQNSKLFKNQKKKHTFD